MDWRTRIARKSLNEINEIEKDISIAKCLEIGKEFSKSPHHSLRIKESKRWFEKGIKMIQTCLNVHVNDKEKCTTYECKKNILIEMYLGYGMILVDEKEYDKAEKWFLKVLEIDDCYSNAYSGLAMVFFHKQNISKAMELFERSYSLNRKNNAYYFYGMGMLFHYKNDIEKAEEYITKSMIDDDTHFKWNANKYLLDIYIESKDYQKAEKCYLTIIEFDPLDGYSYYLAGEFYSKRLKDFLTANDFYKCAVKRINHLDERAVEMCCKIALFYEDKDCRMAEDCYQKAIEIDPTNLKIYYSLGKLFYRQNKLNEAKKYFKKAISVDPKNKEVAEIYFKVGYLCLYEFRDHIKALKYFDKSVQCNPNYSKAHYEMGKLFGTCKVIRDYQDSLNSFLMFLNSDNLILDDHEENLIGDIIRMIKRCEIDNKKEKHCKDLIIMDLFDNSSSLTFKIYFRKYDQSILFDLFFCIHIDYFKKMIENGVLQLELDFKFYEQVIYIKKWLYGLKFNLKRDVDEFFKFLLLAKKFHLKDLSYFLCQQLRFLSIEQTFDLAIKLFTEKLSTEMLFLQCLNILKNHKNCRIVAFFRMNVDTSTIIKTILMMCESDIERVENHHDYRSAKNDRFSSNLKRLYSEKELIPIKFTNLIKFISNDGDSVVLNKEVLLIKSEYFRTLFYSLFPDAKCREFKFDVSSKVLNVIVQYLYDSIVIDDNITNLLSRKEMNELLTFSNKYLFFHLEMKCKLRLIKSLLSYHYKKRRLHWNENNNVIIEKPIEEINEVTICDESQSSNDYCDVDIGIYFGEIIVKITSFLFSYLKKLY